MTESTSDPNYKHPSAGGEAMQLIASARSPDTDPAVLRTLARDDDNSIRRAVAGNPSTPTDALEMLADDYNALVRWQLISNPNITSEVLHHLATHGNAVMAASVSRHPRTSLESLMHMIRHNTSVEVLRTIAAREDVDDSMLQSIADLSHDEETAWRLVHHANATPELLASICLNQTTHHTARYHAAAQPMLPPEVLTQLSEDQDEHIRRAVAMNSSTPPGVLKRLSDDTPSVCSALVDNPSTPPNALKNLSMKGSLSLDSRLVSHPAADGDLLESLLERYRNVPPEMTDTELMERIATHPRATEHTLNELSQNRSAAVRRAVATNTATPLILLTMLATDDDSQVASAAAISAERRLHPD